MLTLFASDEVSKIAVDANLWYFLAVLATAGPAIIGAIGAMVVNVMKTRMEVARVLGEVGTLRTQLDEYKVKAQGEIEKLQEEHQTCKLENESLKGRVLELEAKIKVLEGK